MKSQNEIKQEVVSGELNPLIGLAKLKELKKELDQIIKEVELEAINEADLYEKTFEFHGYKFEKRSGGRMYDYSKIQACVEAKVNLKTVEDKYKAAASSYEKGLQPVDETGELLQLPIITFRKDSLVIKAL